MPEGLQSSYRGMCSEDAIDNMEEASEKLDEVIELLGDIDVYKRQRQRHAR